MSTVHATNKASPSFTTLVVGLPGDGKSFIANALSNDPEYRPFEENNYSVSFNEGPTSVVYKDQCVVECSSTHIDKFAKEFASYKFPPLLWVLIVIRGKFTDEVKPFVHQVSKLFHICPHFMIVANDTRHKLESFQLKQCYDIIRDNEMAPIQVYDCCIPSARNKEDYTSAVLALNKQITHFVPLYDYPSICNTTTLMETDEKKLVETLVFEFKQLQTKVALQEKTLALQTTTIADQQKHINLLHQQLQDLLDPRAAWKRRVYPSEK